MKRKKAYFSISAVAKMFSVHQQTVRLYEKEGLITPKRSEGNTRLFSEEDVDRLEDIIHLTHQLGINLAGVEMILKLKKQISKMQKDMNQLFDQTQSEMTKDTEISKQAIKGQVQQLVQIHQKAATAKAKASTQKAATGHRTEDKVPAPLNTKQQEMQQAIDLDNWEIEYEDE